MGKDVSKYPGLGIGNISAHPGEKLQPTYTYLPLGAVRTSPSVSKNGYLYAR